MMTLSVPTAFNGPIILQQVDIRLFPTAHGLRPLDLRLQAVHRRRITGQRALVMMVLFMRDVRIGGSRLRERLLCLIYCSPQLPASVSWYLFTTPDKVPVGSIGSC